MKRTSKGVTNWTKNKWRTENVFGATVSKRKGCKKNSLGRKGLCGLRLDEGNEWVRDTKSIRSRHGKLCRKS